MERVVLFDGECGFCDASVRWLLERDRERRLRFAALQGRTAAALRARHPEIPEDVDTIVYVESGAGGERVSLRSQAILRILHEVGPESRLLRWLQRIPRPLADLAYGVFVRLRYRLFGRLDTCRVPGPGERGRFLD
jgi:predicted DCC family thiol-disulfide oxidoreductase YuxK